MELLYGNWVAVKELLMYRMKRELIGSSLFACLQVFAEKFPKTPRVAIPNNELFKVDGALTCKSLLICKKPKV